MRNWVEAFRLRTLPLAFSCILMGAFLAIKAHQFDGMVLLLCLATTLFLQILSNLANDYGDSVHGADSLTRQGPSRAVQSGKITLASMKVALIVFSGLSLISGLSLLFLVFGLQQLFLLLIFLTIGLGAIWAAVKYTAGDNPYGYAGLGDISVFLFFGLVGVLGTNYLFTQSINWTDLLPAISCGAFATGVLNVNNIRDIESDTEAGKRSIPVRIGRKKARVYHLILLSLGMVSMLVYASLDFQVYTDFLFVLSFPLFIINVLAVFRKTNAKSLDPYLKQLALSTLLFVLLFGLGLIWT